MKSTEDKASNLHALIRRLAETGRRADAAEAACLRLPAVADDDLEPIDPVRELVYSMLLWEAGSARAAGAAGHLCEHVVDINELRSCLEEELVQFLGPRYPKAAERAARLRAALGQVYSDMHTVSLAELTTMNKRDARAYLEAVPGVPPFAAARVALLSLGAHAFPVDRRLHRILVKANAANVKAFGDTVGRWLERQIHAGEALDAYLFLEGACAHDEAATRAASRESVT